MADGRNGHYICPCGCKSDHTNNRNTARKAYSLFLEKAELTDNTVTLRNKFKRSGRQDTLKHPKSLIRKLIIGTRRCLMREGHVWKLSHRESSDVVLFITYILLEMITSDELAPQFEYSHTRRTSISSLTPTRL